MFSCVHTQYLIKVKVPSWPVFFLSFFLFLTAQAGKIYRANSTLLGQESGPAPAEEVLPSFLDLIKYQSLTRLHCKGHQKVPLRIESKTSLFSSMLWHCGFCILKNSYTVLISQLFYSRFSVF